MLSIVYRNNNVDRRRKLASSDSASLPFAGPYTHRKSVQAEGLATAPQTIESTRALPVTYLPLAPTREQIFFRAVNGQSDRQIAKHMQIPIAQVRLVLDGYERINERKMVCRKSADRAMRVADQAIEAEVWQELAQEIPYTPTPGAPGLRRAA